MVYWVKCLKVKLIEDAVCVAKAFFLVVIGYRELYMTRLMEVFMGTTVKTVFALFVLLFSMSPVLQASEDCNSLTPEWKLKDTNCRIYPYYYKVKLVRDDKLDCECTGDYKHDYDKHGESTEYITGYHCFYGDGLPDYLYYYGCEEPEYSCDYSCLESTDPNFTCNDTHPRYGCWMFCLECYEFYDTCTSDGGWRVPPGSQGEEATQFNRNYNWTDSGTHDYDKDWTREYKEELTIDAIFDKPSDPNCYTKPEIHVSKYDSKVLVKAKDGDICCETNGAQTISISCSGAAHIKAVDYTKDNGQLYTVLVEHPSDVDECDMNNHSGPSVKVTYSPRDGEIDYQEGLEEEVTVSCTFYDNAGNECGSASESITFVLDCPPLPDKG